MIIKLDKLFNDEKITNRIDQSILDLILEVILKSMKKK